MAITFANLGATANPDINSSTDAASYATASWTPPTSGLIILYVLGARTLGPTTPTVSGNGITWVQIGSTLSMAAGERALSLFGADASGSSAGATTISFGGVTQIGCCASFFHADGVDLTGGVAAAFVQTPTNTASTGTSGSITLAAAGNAANRPIVGWFHSTSEATTHRTNWTEMDDILGTSPSRALETQCREDAFETTASASWATSSFRGGIAAELKATLVTTPTAPSDLVATAVSSSQIDLTWTDNASNETGFELERSLDGSTGWTQIATPAANATSYSDTGLSAATTYYYRIRAVNGAGNSSYSATASDTTTVAAPTAPSGLTATAAGTDEIDLVWVDNASNETGFELERSLNGTTGWTQIATPAADAESYTDTGLDPGTEYFYRIRAVNAGGNSAYSATASDTTDALSPSLVTNTDLMHLYMHSPEIVFAARVNMPNVTYPVQDIHYDTVTTGVYTDMAPDMFFTLGSTAGGDDYGRGRLRAMPTATILKVGRASQGTNDGELDVVNNAYITVYDDYRVHAKIPYINSTGVMYKDSDMPVSDRTTDPPPVANTGPAFAGTIDDVTGLITVHFQGSLSFAVADGATITGYNWDIKDGSFTLGSVFTDDDIFATFSAGFRWVALTVTDSNGKTHTARVPVYARDPDDDTTVQSWQLESHTRRKNGAEISFRILEDLPRSTYPDGALVLCWQGEATEPQSRTHMVFTGWHQSDRVTERATETALLADTVLECVDVAGRLDTLPGFPQTIEDDATRDEDVNPDITWAFMTTPNMDKYIHYLLQWHSTALDLADYFPSGTGDDYPFIIFQSDGQTLYEQVERKATQIVPDHHFNCNRRGQLKVVVDPMLQNVADRTATVQGGFLEQWWAGLDFVYNRPPRVHRLYASAVLAGTSEPLGTAFSVAPGTAPSQGTNEVTHGEQLARTQEDLNDVTGHRYARMNARHGLITVTAASGNDQDIDPADMTWVELFTSADTAPQRGMALGNTTRCLPHEVRIDYRHTETGTIQETRVTLEVETAGRPALTEERTGALPVGDVPDLPLVTIPPGFGLEDGVQMVAGVDLDGYIYRTTDFQTPSGSGGPTWDRVDTGITETIYSWVVDPFSPGYIEGVGSIDGWIATETDIYRVENIFGVTPTVTSVHTFTTPATAASFHWRSIQASFGAYFEEGVNPWLLCISYYGDTSGHTGTWALRSVDGGATWQAETQVSAAYDTDTPTRFNPVGVYASPKTPGLAYTAAHIVAGDDSLIPLWAIVNADTGEVVNEGVSPTIEHRLEAIAAGAVALAETDEYHLVVAPPANAVRIVIEGFYENTVTVTSDAFTSFSATYALDEPVGTPAPTEDLTFTQPPGTGGVTSQFYTVEWTRDPGATDWEGNRTEFEASPPIDGSNYRHIVMQIDASKVGSSSVCTNELFHHATVVEIELEDSTIYTPTAEGSAADGFVSTDWGETWTEETGMIEPGQGQAGSIHLPWPTNDNEDVAYYGHFDKTGNREFRLKRADGGTITDISPATTFGVNRGPFGVRTFDSNRQYVVAAVIDNDSSTSADDDTHAVYVSDDFGDTWTNIVAAVADTSAPADRPAFEAAFGGDSEQVIFIWGPAGYISYSTDFGATIDSRAGNLGTLGATGFIGIAGGADRMSIKEQVRQAAQRFVVQAELASYERAKVGMINGDGSITIVVPKRTDFIYVTKADSTVTIALNRGTVPLQYGLPIKMRVEAGVYVVQGRDRVMEAPGTGTDNPYGVNPHNLNTHTDVTITSPADDQFLRYNGTEWVNETVTAGAVDSVNGQTGAVVLDTDDIAEGATNLWFTAAEETKLASIAAGAEVNVNADWSAVSGDAQILNKPAIPATFDDLTDGTTNKAYTSTEKTKLAGIEALADVTDQDNVGAAIHGATAKTTPVDADTMPLIDSAASNVLKKITWANIKAALTTLFNGLYVLAAGKAGGQTVYGGTASGESMVLSSTSHATKGDVVIQPNGGRTIIGGTTATAGIPLTAKGASSKSTAGAITVGVFASGDASDELQFLYQVVGSATASNRMALAQAIEQNVAFRDLLLNPYGGNVGIGTGVSANPLGRLHVHDGTSGKLFVTKTAINATAQTIIPDGTGDVTAGGYYTIVVKLSTGAVFSSSNAISNGSDTVVYDDGTNKLNLRINANGSMDTRRTGGTATFTLTLHFVWQ